LRRGYFGPVPNSESLTFFGTSRLSSFAPCGDRAPGARKDIGLVMRRRRAVQMFLVIGALSVDLCSMANAKVGSAELGAIFAVSSSGAGIAAPQWLTVAQSSSASIPRGRKRLQTSPSYQGESAHGARLFNSPPRLNWEVPAKAIPKVGSPEWDKEQAENAKKEQRLRSVIQGICRGC
jgi:hypothetical protein